MKEQQTLQGTLCHALTGILGALLGMLMCILLSWMSAPIYDGQCAMILLMISSPIIMAGYRWCRGLKNKAFAYAVTGLLTLLVGLVSPVVALTAKIDGDVLVVLLDLTYWSKLKTLHLILCAVAMFGFWSFRTSLLMYTAPPRMRPVYEAGKYAGGLLYNLYPERHPEQAVPWQFSVGRRLAVEGETLRTTPPVRKSKVFSVRDIAGVVLGGCTGSNVLYDKDYQVLAKFAWSMKGSQLLMQYLLQHQVPIDNFPPQIVDDGTSDRWQKPRRRRGSRRK